MQWQIALAAPLDGNDEIALEPEEKCPLVGVAHLPDVTPYASNREINCPSFAINEARLGRRVVANPIGIAPDAAANVGHIGANANPAITGMI